MIKKIAITVTILAIIGGGCVGGLMWYAKNQKKSQNNSVENYAYDYQKAQKLLQNNDPYAAMKIVQEYEEVMLEGSEWGFKWLDLLIEVSEVTKNGNQLAVIYQLVPQAFKDKEAASLLVAESLLFLRNQSGYDRLREEWKGKESKFHSWLSLDANRLLIEDKRSEAIELVKSMTFKGNEECNRLVHLALLYWEQDPKTTWSYLNKAYELNPKNIKVRTQRARYLEFYKNIDFAESEYLAAASYDITNPSLKNNLGGFYLRQKRYPEAIHAWYRALANNSSTSTWLKVLFWKKVTLPLKLDLDSIKIPSGELKPLIEHLLTLKKGEFWNKEEAKKKTELNKFFRSQQATFWLRTIEALKNKEEKETKQLFDQNLFKDFSWNNDLYIALKRIFSYRESQQFYKDSMYKISPNSHSFFKILDQIANQADPEISEELHKLLVSEEVFSIAFISAGWLEAGVGLRQLDKIPHDFPDWVSFNLSRAIYAVKGAQPALNFALNQKKSSHLALLIGEIYISIKEHAKAKSYLEPFLKINSSLGLKAAQLLTTDYLEQEKFDEARKSIYTHREFSKSVLGQVLDARIYLLQGDIERAEDIYRQFEEKSVEAKSYFVRKAFKNQNFEKAKKLSIELLKEYPNNHLIRSNLKNILDSEAKNSNEVN